MSKHEESFVLCSHDNRTDSLFHTATCNPVTGVGLGGVFGTVREKIYTYCIAYITICLHRSCCANVTQRLCTWVKLIK